MPGSASSINLNADYSMKDLSHYTALAEMFSYPAEDLKTYIGEWRKIVINCDPSLYICLERFIDHVEHRTSEYRQEYFVSTFYVQPLCCLDIGYVLFGEDYRRGQFMANLKKEHRLSGNDCGTELPDHLPVVLKLVPKLTSGFAEELVYSLLIPAVNEMIVDFKGEKNFYKDLLRIVLSVMEKDFPDSKFEQFRFEKRGKDSRKTAKKTMPE